MTNIYDVAEHITKVPSTETFRTTVTKGQQKIFYRDISFGKEFVVVDSLEGRYVGITIDGRVDTNPIVVSSLWFYAKELNKLSAGEVYDIVMYNAGAEASIFLENASGHYYTRFIPRRPSDR